MSNVCDKCGAVHVTPLGFPACKAHTKRGACRANPVRGAAVCSKHGLTGAARKKAAERVAVAKVEKTMGELRAEYDRPDEHPFAALVDLSRRLAAMTRALESMVDDYRANGDDENLHAALAVYERFGRLSTQVSKTVLDANLDERLVQIDEARTVLLANVVEAAMRRADLSVMQKTAMRQGIAAEIRALPA